MTVVGDYLSWYGANNVGTVITIACTESWRQARGRLGGLEAEVKWVRRLQDERDVQDYPVHPENP